MQKHQQNCLPRWHFEMQLPLLLLMVMVVMLHHLVVPVFAVAAAADSAGLVSSQPDKHSGTKTSLGSTQWLMPQLIRASNAGQVEHCACSICQLAGPTLEGCMSLHLSITSAASAARSVRSCRLFTVTLQAALGRPADLSWDCKPDVFGCTQISCQDAAAFRLGLQHAAVAESNQAC